MLFVRLAVPRTPGQYPTLRRHVRSTAIAARASELCARTGAPHRSAKTLPEGRETILEQGAINHHLHFALFGRVHIRFDRAERADALESQPVHVRRDVGR